VAGGQVNISFKVLGFEIARIDVDVDLLTDDSPQATPVDKVIGRVSTWWVKRGMK